MELSCQGYFDHVLAKTIKAGIENSLIGLISIIVEWIEGYELHVLTTTVMAIEQRHSMKSNEQASI